MSAPVVTIQESAGLDQVAAILAKRHFHHVPVIDDRRRLLGVITHAHLWEMLGKNAE
jgi:CBS-domain-containing membrane protein